MEVKVNRSNKRRKTISARLVGNTMYVNVPAEIQEGQLARVVKNFQKRFEKRKLKKELNKDRSLKSAAEKLNKEYFGKEIQIHSIEYVTNQNRLFGSCNSRKKTIRISHRLAGLPQWVRDYVIVHEMAHIIEPNHSKSFWDIVSRYALAERARGYLIAKGFETEESDIESS